MPQLATWRVVIGEGVSPYGPQTFLHHSQLATWRVMAQSHAIFGGPSTTPQNSTQLK